jgi:hypothetical protein
LSNIAIKRGLVTRKTGDMSRSTSVKTPSGTDKLDLVNDSQNKELITTGDKKGHFRSSKMKSFPTYLTLFGAPINSVHTFKTFPTYLTIGGFPLEERL